MPHASHSYALSLLPQSHFVMIARLSLMKATLQQTITHRVDLFKWPLSSSLFQNIWLCMRFLPIEFTVSFRTGKSLKKTSPTTANLPTCLLALYPKSIFTICFIGLFQQVKDPSMMKPSCYPSSKSFELLLYQSAFYVLHQAMRANT